MTCANCITAKGFNGYRMFNPACIYCGARLIQRLGMFQIPTSECTTRRRAVLADWMAHGHDEAQIRALVKGPLAIAP